MADLYHVLGVGREAGEAEIKKAFRRIALECHPDRLAASSAEHRAQAASRFKAASEAYEALMEARRLGLKPASRSSRQASHNQQYYSRQSYAQNPYGHSFRATNRYKTAGQRSGLYPFLMALSRNMSRTDAMFHVGLASLLTFGIILGGTSGEYLWSKWNRGLLYEDLQRSLAEQDRKESWSATKSSAGKQDGRQTATAAQRAANVAAAAGRVSEDGASQDQQLRPRGLDYGAAVSPSQPVDQQADSSQSAKAEVPRGRAELPEVQSSLTEATSQSGLSHNEGDKLRQTPSQSDPLSADKTDLSLSAAKAATSSESAATAAVGQRKPRCNR